MGHTRRAKTLTQDHGGLIWRNLDTTPLARARSMGVLGNRPRGPGGGLEAAWGVSGVRWVRGPSFSRNSVAVPVPECPPALACQPQAVGLCTHLHLHATYIHSVHTEHRCWLLEKLGLHRRVRHSQRPLGTPSPAEEMARVTVP